MRQTFFGPLIEEVERKIIKQQGKSWDRDLFENQLMGYSLRADRHRLVAWLDYRNIESEPLYLELYDHAKDPEETGKRRRGVSADSGGVVETIAKKWNRERSKQVK